MSATWSRKLLLILILLAIPLAACNSIPQLTFHGTPIVPPSSSTNDTDINGLTLNQWQPVQSGIELRYEHWKSPGNTEDTVTILRLDPHTVHISVGYQPNDPLLMSEWVKQTNALAMINGGYFNDHNHATSMVISNGHVLGTSYVGFGGMFGVDTQGNVELRSLRDQPYDPTNDALTDATQSSPMLIMNGKRTQFNANAATQRRSVIAVDTQGRLLLIASPNAAFSLDELADLLSTSDLSLQTALNLDGGASTGLYLHSDKQHVTINPLTALPLVIIVKP